MPRDFEFYNIGKANDAIKSIRAAMAPALLAAKITTVKVDGKDVPVSDAPPADAFNALLSFNPIGAESQSVDELLKSNNILSARAQKADEDLKLSTDQVSQLTREKIELENKLNVATDSVKSLTAKGNELGTSLEASQTAAKAAIKAGNDTNRLVSKMAIAFACVELKGEDGKALSPNASTELKEAAADKIPVAEKLTAISGALNAAASRIGVDFSGIPNGGPAAGAKAPVNILDQYNAITHPQDRQAFYRKNKEAIDACYRH